MPIIIRAKRDDHPGDIIKKFKKVVAATDIIQIVKDRRYFQKPSELRTVRMNEIRRMKKRLRSIKKLKNPPIPKPPRRPRTEKRTFGEDRDRA
jgi:ribosomal protein S21